MKKSTIGIFIGIAVSILAITFIPGLVNYVVSPSDTSSDTSSISSSDEPAEPVYHRVEAQKYVFTIGGDSSYGMRIKVKLNSTSAEQLLDFQSNAVSAYTIIVQSTGYIHLNAYSSSSAPTYPDIYTDYVVEDYGSYKLASDITGEEESLPIVRTAIYDYVLVE